MSLIGGCLCGSVRYRASEARRVTHCHCVHCRKASGAPFVTWVEVASNTLVFEGERRFHASRPKVTRGFCVACGTQLTYQHEEEPEIVDLTVASLDDPAAVEPEDHVWFSRRIPWVRVDDGLPTYERARFDP